jgi:hypothetical protein
MKTRFLANVTDRISLIAASVLLLVLAAPGFAQTHIVNAFPAAAASTANKQLPNGVKIIARVQLEGQPVTRMYTQWEYGRTYLYIEHGQQSLTTVDVSKKRSPQIANHAPGRVEPERYEQLAEGGTILVSPMWHVNAGIDNLGGRGMLSILQSGDPADAKLLEAFGPGYCNLADRDHRLVYFASPSQLLVVQDNRMTAIDYTFD